MRKSVKSVFVFLSFVLILPCLLIFSGCGTNYTYSDFKTNYSKLLEKYEGQIFESGTVSINYSFGLQTLIDNGTPEDQFNKFSSEPDNEQAIFEPVLRSSFEAINFFVNTSLDTSKVSQESLKNVLGQITVVDKTINDVLRDKRRLEEITNEDGNTINWIKNYRQNLHTAIKASNKLALGFMNMFKNEIFSENLVDGRVSYSSVILSFVDDLAESADIFEKFVLPDIIDDVIPSTASQNLCNRTLERFLEIKATLKGDFQKIQILDTVASTYENRIIDCFDLLKNYKTTFKISKHNAETAIGDFNLEDLRYKQDENKLSDNEKVCIDAVDEFLNLDFEIVSSYELDIINEIKDWKTSRGS